MKSTLVVLLATLALAVVLGPMAMKALQKPSADVTTPAVSGSPVATILNPDGTVASSPGNGDQAAHSDARDHDDEDKDDDNDD